MARRSVSTGASSHDSDWQPVQPTSIEERRRLRSGQFVPLIGTSTSTPQTEDFRTHARPNAGTNSPNSSNPPRSAIVNSSNRATSRARQAERAATERAAKRRMKSRAPFRNDNNAHQTAGETSGRGNAIAAILFGITALILLGSAPAFALVFGIIAIYEANRAAKHGKRAKAGRVLGVLGVVIAAIVVMAGIAVFIEENMDTGVYESTTFPNTASRTPSYSLTAEEQAVTDLAEARFALIESPDETTIAQVGALLDEDLRSYYGLSFADLGVDSADVARWIMDGSSCTLSSVYAFPEDGEGSAYADVTVRDTYVLFDALAESASATGLDESDARYRELLGQTVRETLQESPATVDRFVSIELAYANDTWSVDEASWTETLRSLYYL